MLLTLKVNNFVNDANKVNVVVVDDDGEQVGAVDANEGQVNVGDGDVE